MLLLKKRTRYELEKLQFPGISDKQLECIIRKRGSDFDTLFTTHKFQKAFTKGLIEKFKSVAGEVEVVDRWKCRYVYIYKFKVHKVHSHSCLCYLSLRSHTFCLKIQRTAWQQSFPLQPVRVLACAFHNFHCFFRVKKIYTYMIKISWLIPFN